MRVRCLACVLMACLVCAGCMELAYLSMPVLSLPYRLERDRRNEADRKWREASGREQYGEYNCPAHFVDICWEFDPADAHSALSAPPPWDTYKRIVEHLREQPLPLNDKRSLKVYEGVRRGLLNKPLTRRQYAEVLSDAAHFVKSPKAGDSVSAAMLLSALTRTLIPARLHLSSPDEQGLAREVAALLVPAYERALAELSSDKEAHWGAAYALAQAEICLGSAYEFAAFVEQDPAEKERLFAKAFAVYSRAVESPYWFLQIMAGISGSQAAATDQERLELARRLTIALSAEFQRGSGLPFHGNALYYYSFNVNLFLYDTVRPAFKWVPLFWDFRASKLPWPTTLNVTLLEIWESCESADTRRAVVDILLGLNAVKAHGNHIPKGAIAALMLELHVRSGDEHWLRAAPDYLRAGGDSLPAAEWKKLAERARRRRAELLAQLDAPNVCRDSDGLVIRARGTANLITKPGECAAANSFIARYPMAAERRPSWLGAEHGGERYIWESMPSVGHVKPQQP